MSVRAYYDIWCDHPDCSEWDPRCTSDSAKECRDIAREIGWQLTRNGQFCPVHRAQNPIPPGQWTFAMQYGHQTLTPDPTFETSD